MSWAEAARSYLAVRHGPRSRIRWTLAMLNYQFFIDDTGKPREEFCGAGGYLATYDDWSSYLRELDIAFPEGTWAREAGFKDLLYAVKIGRASTDTVDAWLTLLRGRMHSGYTRLVHMESWNALPTKYKRLFHHPYSLAVALLLSDVAYALNEFRGLPDDERLVTIAEHMLPYNPKTPAATSQRQRRGLELRTQKIWQHLVDLRGLTDRILPLEFDHKRGAPQLLAADLIAHAGYRVQSRPHRPLGFTGVPYVWTPGAAPFPDDVYLPVAEFLREKGPPTHYHGTADYQALQAIFPTLDRIIERLEEDRDEDSPLDRYFGLDDDAPDK